MDKRERSKKREKEKLRSSKSSKSNDNERKSGSKPVDDSKLKKDRRTSSNTAKGGSSRDVKEEKSSSKDSVGHEIKKERSHKRIDRNEEKVTSRDRSRDNTNGNAAKVEEKSIRHRKPKHSKQDNDRNRHRESSHNRDKDVKQSISKTADSVDKQQRNDDVKTGREETPLKQMTKVKSVEAVTREREQSMLQVIESKAVEEETDFNYDDEEFDDYDDDFESEADDEDNNESSSCNDSDSYVESSESPLEASNHTISDAERLQIREAMVLENSRVGSSSPSMLPSSPANTPVPSSPSNENRDKAKLRKSIRGLDFVAAQKTQAVNKALSKTAQRGNDLMRLIELDTIYFELFEMKPQTEYELFMKSFGRSDTYQKYTQYNEDSIDKDTITEASDTKTCWTQHPIEASVASAHEGEEVEEEEGLGRYNPLTLSKFVYFSSQVMFTLFEERASRHGYTHTFKPIESSKFSDTSAVYPPNQIASGRSPIFTCPISAQMFIICYTKSKTDSLVNSPGFSCTWNLQNVYDPVNVLVSNSVHRCACVSSYNHNVIFVGCEDGSISLWDLNEPDNMHKTLNLNNNNVVVRLPTYNTCGIQVAESHNSKITNIQAIRFDQEQLQMSSYQIASLDEHGVIIIWVVVSVVDTSFSGSQTDLGLRPGGKIKLVKSASINVNFPPHIKDLFPELRTYTFQQSCSDTSTYFVATDKGAVLKASRAQTLSQPTYYSEDHAVPSIVGSIDFNNFNWKYFLCGSSDGSISLYSVSRNTPLVVWDRSTRGRPVRTVQWSKYSSTIFYAMDSASKFYMWDLSVRDSTPLVIEVYDQKGLLSFTELLPSAGTTSPVVVMSFKDGSLEAHHVKEEAMNNKVNNITKLENYLSLVL